ncbi:G-protein coupled receptor daf-37 [Lingula anatina]|uniref:G-protein coupled receptor daf-37 n=1 Tax=Lingula anatina TaxID=7574 RepID=A0A1S3HQ01_LINAN|nr:G-protein coupled receptor daf-37 [Lingula anatina]|eukprot:XP_013388133.2 G-protein coupled receptor daf-37 [Lingula anatina]
MMDPHEDYTDFSFSLDKHIHNTTDGVLYPETILTRTLWKVVPIVLLVFGTFGNLASLMVMTRKVLRETPVGILLATLAVSDLVVLWVGLMRHILRAYGVVELRYISTFACHITRFLTYFSMDFSAWVLVAVTVDRFIAVCMPTRAVDLCTVRKAALSLMVIAALITAKTMHVFWTRGSENVTLDGNVTVIYVCGYTSDGDRYFWQHVLPWVVFCIYVSGPFLTMIVLNILIIKGLFKIEQRRWRLSNRSTETGTGNGLLDHYPSDRNADGHTAGRRSDQQEGPLLPVRSLTIMLLAVSISFLLLSFPAFINRMVQSYWKRDIASAREKARLDLTEVMVLMLNYTNHSINFFLYCLTGRRFRKELKLCFRDVMRCN